MNTEGRVGARRGARVAGPEPATMQKLAGCETTDLADVMEAAGFMDAAIRPLHTNFRPFAGPAVTVAVPSGSQEVRKIAMGMAQAGDVLVINARGIAAFAVLGGKLARGLVDAGVVAVVADGYVRDVAEIEALGLPVFCRGHNVAASPKTGPGEVNVPIACGGVAVHPGDVVVGDRNGIIVVPREAAAEILEAAQALQG